MRGRCRALAPLLLAGLVAALPRPGAAQEGDGPVEVGVEAVLWRLDPGTPGGSGVYRFGPGIRLALLPPPRVTRPTLQLAGAWAPADGPDPGVTTLLLEATTRSRRTPDGDDGPYFVGTLGVGAMHYTLEEDPGAEGPSPFGEGWRAVTRFALGLDVPLGPVLLQPEASAVFHLGSGEAGSPTGNLFTRFAAGLSLRP